MMQYRFALVCLLYPFTLKAQVQFKSVPAEVSGIHYANVIHETRDRNIGRYDYFYNGGGVAIGDLNNDKLPDIFLTGNDSDDAFYLNQGNLKFSAYQVQAGLEKGGWSTGVTLADVNSDGWLDIYVCRSGPDYQQVPTPNKLYINQQDGTFLELAKEYGVAGNELSTQAVFFDMENDGDLDLFVLNHGVRNLGNQANEWWQKMKQLSPSEYRRFCHTLYLNENGRFTDITEQAGLLVPGFGLGVSITDFDRDGYLDIFIANDFFLPDQLFKRQSNGTYKDKLDAAFSHVSFSSMGCDVADVNADGWPDLMVLDMSPSTHEAHMQMHMSMSEKEIQYLESELLYKPQYMHNMLYINKGLGVMSEISRMAGVSATDWSWASLFADFDNDGREELLVTNGYRRETMNSDWRRKLIQKMKEGDLQPQTYFDWLQQAPVMPVANKLFSTENGFVWSEQGLQAGLTALTCSQGAAYGDLDLDGDLDLVISNLDTAVLLYENVSPSNPYLRIQLHTDTVQAHQVIVYTPKGSQYRFSQVSRGFQSAVEHIWHFGLGATGAADSLDVVWQNGVTKRFYQIPENQVWQILPSDGKEVPTAFAGDTLLFINQTARLIKPSFYHRENLFNDFRMQRFLPFGLSQFGPSVAVADVNLDGLQDFFIGGAAQQMSMIYMQKPDGTFAGKNISKQPENEAHEVWGASFFYLNGDSLPDIYVACGGGIGSSAHIKNRDIVYVNKGDGNFEEVWLQDTLANAVVAPCDYDNDGDQDIFTAGRIDPGKYPNQPPVLLWQQDQGSLKPVIETALGGLSKCGMVTGAVWSDLNMDGRKDLIISAEYRWPMLFLNTTKGFVEVEYAGRDTLLGWWNTVVAADLDGDGDEDFLFGNTGSNLTYQPDKKHPLRLWYGDLNGDKIQDLLWGMKEGYHWYPIQSREEILMLFPFLESAFPNDATYAKATMSEILQKLDAIHIDSVEVNYTESVIFWNEGLLRFSVQPLPVEAQVSATYGFVVEDFNADTFADILLAGNNAQVGPGQTALDASMGLYLKGKGYRTWEPVWLSVETGVFLPGDVRGLQYVLLGEKKQHGILVPKNNSRLNLLVWDR